MALTITATPADYSSLQGDLIYTVSDADKVADPVSFADFKFIGDVYVGATLVARLKKVPNPVTGIGIFNVGPVVRNYLTTTFDPLINSLVAQEMGDAALNLTVTLKFGEEYNATAFLNVTVDSARIFFNNYNGRLVGITSSMLRVLDRVASNRPFIGKTFLTSVYNLIPYFSTTTATVDLIVTTFGGGIVYSTTFTPTAAGAMQVLNVAPVALNALQPGTITPSTFMYTVQIGDLTYTYHIICEPMYQPFMLHFLNQYGGFDSRIFSKVSRKTYDITRADFGKLPYTVDGAGAVTYKSNNNVYNENRSTYSVQYNEKLQLNSDLLNDGEYAWLGDLILSPMIYIEDGGYFFPCVITDTSYEPKLVVNDDLTNLTINIEYGTQLNAQFR